MASRKRSNRARTSSAATRGRVTSGASTSRGKSTQTRSRALMLTHAPSHVSMLALIMLCALGLYVWRLEQPKQYVYDEVYHAYTAAQLAAGNADALVWYTKAPETDNGVAYEWTHPAFAKLVMQVGVLVFGDNSFGWRIASAVFGALGIGILYALGRVLVDRWVGLLAAGLMLLDGLWFVQSRTAMNDVFVACFLMLAYLTFALYLHASGSKRRQWLGLTGVALGFGMATKWSALFSLGLLGAIAAVREARRWYRRQDASPMPALVTLAGAFVIAPIAIYVTSYVQFFAMGHTWSEWRELQRQMWSYHSNLTVTHTWQSPAWSWPLMITPVWYYVDYRQGSVANIFAMGNPLIWWAFLPAIAFVFTQWRAAQFRSIGLSIILLGFVGQWLPWFFSPRITFLYHMLPSLPFGCLAIAYTLGRLRKQPLMIATYMAVVLICFVYFYPQYAAWPISRESASRHYWLSTWQPR